MFNFYIFQLTLGVDLQECHRRLSFQFHYLKWQNNFNFRS